MADTQTNPKIADAGTDHKHGADVRVQGLVKSYGAFRAVDDVSVSANAGEFLALLGPSGSGKTTLLMAIAGFEMPDQGAILVDGRDVTRLPSNQRNIGVVFQNYALFPHMTVRENIAFPLRRRRLPRREIAQKVDAALGLVRLEAHGDKLPAALSGGQQQRVAIARATVFGPRLLLMDEPLGALDRRLREDMQFEIKELQRRLGVTIIYVTHDQEEAVTMADHIAVMRNARLEQTGKAEDLYDRPANAFVADFVGQTNLIPGHIAAMNNAAITVEIAGGPRLNVSCNAGDTWHAGVPVRLGIRPERLHFLSMGSPGLAGLVVTSIYAGGTRLFLVEIAPGLVVKVRLASDLSSQAAMPGERVTLGWDARYLRLYPN